MKFKIERRYSNDTVVEGEAESFKEFVGKNKSNLSDSNLRNSDLSDSNLSYSNLRNSDLSDSNLSYSNLSYSDLSDSDLSYSDLSYSDLSYCRIKASQKEVLLKALKIVIIED